MSVFADAGPAAPLLARLEAVRRSGRGWMARCPAHADRSPSLKVDVPDGRRVLVFDHGGCDADDVLAAAGLTWRDLSGQSPAAAPPAPPRPVAGLRRPEAAAELWSTCPGVFGTAAATWLASRGIDVAAVEDLDLARVLPPGKLPRWARCQGRSWRESGHELMVPMFDSQGQLLSLHARAVAGAGPKGLTPAGCSTKALVMADPLGQLLLAGAADDWPDLVVVITEGVPDYLAAATQASDADEEAPAVLGILAGCWTPEMSARIPLHAEVVLATDGDAAGCKYAAGIVSTLAGQRVRRWAPGVA